MHAYILVKLKGTFDRDALDFGALTITHTSGRSYLLDVTKSWLSTSGNGIELLASEDFETFPKSDEDPYDLTAADIASGDLKATLFVGGEDATELDSITYRLLDAECGVLADNLIATEE
jgi:hypothetical protein